MNVLDNIENFYFVGIGGIGMSALARYFYANGKRVAGYDRTHSGITAQLQTSGIAVRYKINFDDIDPVFKDPKTTWVIYTPAVSKDNAELESFRESGHTIKKRAEVLGHIARGKFCLAVAGTHGKTTTSTILGHLLAETGAPVTAFLGGISKNYNSNLIQKGTDVIVVEADEFDRSFLQLEPDIACITSMDADHLDIYGNAETLNETFCDFAAKVKDSKKLFIKKGLPLKGREVAVDEDADYCVKNIRIREGSYVFDFHYPDGVLNDLLFNLPGRHNLFNAATALGMAMEYGSPTDRLPKALLSFKGVDRRFTYVVKSADFVLIDDYAHHPTEIDAAHDAVREMYPGEKVLGIFQPHLFSRTRDFMKGFAKSLSRFDGVLMLDIYPAREEPLAGVDAQALIDKMKGAKVTLVTKENLAEKIYALGYKINIVMGAGDIGTLVDGIVERNLE